jgi:hypothetical protein
MMMVNADMSCAICDVCVLALFPVVRTGYAGTNPYEKPEGLPN